MKTLLLIGLLPLFLSAQSNPVGPARFDNNWLNGYSDQPVDTMFGGSTMNFDTYPPKVVREHRRMDFYVTNSSFSDQNGKLLAYSNGNYIANALNDTMLNGAGINPDYTIYQDVLYQGVVFLPQPGNDSIIYLFHEQLTSTPSTVNTATVFLAQYTLINVWGESGLGKVIKKNIPLLQDTLCFGKITATKHANGRDWWIIIPKYDQPTYFTYLLTPYGIDTFLPQTIGNPTFSNEGQATFSPDGTKYVRLNNLGFEYGAWMDILDFDRCTGKLSNYRGFYKSVGGSAGVSISPNSRYLYFSRGITVHQYDLWADDVEALEKLVATYDGFANPLPTNFWMSQLAPDGKIYVGSNSSVKNYHIIHHPDQPGLACNFEQHAIDLPTIASRSIPTFPYYRLGPLDGSACDTLGIDNLPVADFRIDKTADTFGFELVDLSYYNPTAWHWDFGDRTQSPEQNPGHTYSAAGAYQICLIASNEYAADTICRTLQVGNVVTTNEPAKGYQIRASPNPVDDVLTIAYSIPVGQPGMRVQLISPVGALVSNVILTGMQGTQQLELSPLPAGLYYLRFVANGQVISVQKISIVHEP